MKKKYIVWALVAVAIIGCSLPTTSSVHADNCSIGTFTVDKTSVLPSENVTVTYFVSGCTKSSIVATDTVTGKTLRNLPDGTGSGGGSFALSGIENKVKIVFTVYSGTTVAASKELTVEPKITVSADPCTITSFVSDKQSITKGESTMLRWKTSAGCGSIEVAGDSGNVLGEQTGTLSISPSQTKVYFIFASKTSGAQAEVASTTVTVTEPSVTPTPTPAPVTPVVELPIESPGFPEPAPAPETITPTQDSPFYTYSVGGNDPNGVAFSNPGWTGGDAIGSGQSAFGSGVGFGAGQGDAFGSSGDSSVSFLDWLTGKKKKDKQKLNPLQTITISDPKLSESALEQSTPSATAPTVATGLKVTPPPSGAGVPASTTAQSKNPSLFEALKTLFDRLIFWR